MLPSERLAPATLDEPNPLGLGEGNRRVTAVERDGWERRGYAGEDRGAGREINAKLLAVADLEISHGDRRIDRSAAKRLDDRQPGAGDFDVIAERVVARAVVAEIELGIAAGSGDGGLRTILPKRRRR